MTKILIDGRLYGLENAGLGRYLTNLVDNLSSLDRENSYVILLRKKYYDTLAFPENWKKVLADYRHYSFLEQIKIPIIIKKEKPDITHFPHFNVPFFYHGRYIVTIHDMLMHKSKGLSSTTLPFPLYFFKRIGYRTVFDNAVKKSVSIITPSQAVKRELVEKYNLNSDKVKVTYEGFDERILYKSWKLPPKPYFVYAGNAYPHKNLSNLLKAIKLLNTKSNQKVFLAIASARNIFTRRVEKMVETSGIKDKVFMLGFVPDEKLGALYKESVGFVFPSFSEGFGLPGLEAMASGTILLASDIEVFHEVYGNNALYFNPNSKDSIASAMAMALAVTPKERAQRIVDSEEFIKKYSWKKMAEETLEIYNSIQENPGRKFVG